MNVLFQNQNENKQIMGLYAGLKQMEHETISYNVDSSLKFQMTVMVA